MRRYRQIGIGFAYQILRVWCSEMSGWDVCRCCTDPGYVFLFWSSLCLLLTSFSAKTQSWCSPFSSSQCHDSLGDVFFEMDTNVWNLYPEGPLGSSLWQRRKYYRVEEAIRLPGSGGHIWPRVDLQSGDGSLPLSSFRRRDHVFIFHMTTCLDGWQAIPGKGKRAWYCGRLLQARLLGAGCMCRQHTASGEMNSVLPGKLRACLFPLLLFLFARTVKKPGLGLSLNF